MFYYSNICSCALVGRGHSLQPPHLLVCLNLALWCIVLVSVPTIWLFNWCRVVIGSSGVGGGVPQLQSVFVDFWNAILNNNVTKMASCGV